MKRAITDISKENRKQFILDCAEQLILEEGLSNLNIGKVSKKSKLAIGTIYIYFSSKKDTIARLTIKYRAILFQKFIEYTNKKVNALEKLAELRHGNCLKSKAEIAKALQTNGRKDYLFALNQELEMHHVYQSKITQCDIEIEKILSQVINRSVDKRQHYIEKKRIKE